MMDVVQALELFEICAEEIASEDVSGRGDPDAAGGRRLSLAARARAKRQLPVAQLARFPQRALDDPTSGNQPAMTLGAMVVFRTADKFGRAGASTERTFDGIYHAVQRYVEIIPRSLQDDVDKAAISALLTQSPWPGRESLRSVR